MPVTCPDRIELTGTQHQQLTRVVRAGRSQQRLAARARIMLLADTGRSNTVIAQTLGLCADTVRKPGSTCVQ